MEITEKMLIEAEAYTQSVNVSVAEAEEYVAECRRFGCGYGDD